MKLTEAKLKSLINEMLNENNRRAKLVFDMIVNSFGKYGFEVENQDEFDQAVSLAIGANLVNEVLALIDEELAKYPGWEYYGDMSDQGYAAVYGMGMLYTSIRKAFLDRVKTDVGSMMRKSYASSQKNK